MGSGRSRLRRIVALAIVCSVTLIVVPTATGIIVFHNGATVHHKLVFGASGADAQGNELWRTDGTRKGTKLVKNIFPGGGDSYPQGFLRLNASRALFSATTPDKGRELWRTDGTKAGTKLVKDISVQIPGSSSYPSDGFLYKGSDYFTAVDNIHGYEVWKSDGTSKGTKMLKDIAPGPDGGAFVIPFGILKGRLYFGAIRDGKGGELWRTDGTRKGTKLFKDVNPALNGMGMPVGSLIDSFARVGKRLYFSAYRGSGKGYAIFRTDGTKKGTKVAFEAPYPTVQPDHLQRFRGKLMFSAYSDTKGVELYRSDGTKSGTKRITDINHGVESSYPYGLIAIGKRAYFTARDDAHGIELWRTDGTTKGTKRVKDIVPGPGDGVCPQAGMERLGKRLILSAIDPDHGEELWRSDGTSAGTKRVKDIRPGPDSSKPMCAFN